LGVDEWEHLRDNALQAAYRISARIIDIKNVLGPVHEALIQSEGLAHSHADAVEACIRGLAFAADSWLRPTLRSWETIRVSQEERNLLRGACDA
jgi:hypothetical protein